MITGKIVANAGSHRILAAMSRGVCNTRDLKHVVGAINSVARFEGEYMRRLEAAGYAQCDGDGNWSLTNSGRDKLDELGPVTKRNSRMVATPRTYYTTGIYQPQEHQRPMRPGCEEFLKCPSRVGNALYYRDGRVETLKEPDDGH